MEGNIIPTLPSAAARRVRGQFRARDCGCRAVVRICTEASELLNKKGSIPAAASLRGGPARSHVAPYLSCAPGALSNEGCKAVD